MSDEFHIEEFEKQVETLMVKNQIPGANFGLHKNGQPFYYKGFGYKNVNEKLPLTVDTIFGIASMTKSITCVAIMQLQEAGKLSVNDKVIDHLPKFRMPNNNYTNEVTIHHLMTHTSGIPPSTTHIYARKDSIEQDPAAADYGLDLTDHEGDTVYTYEQLLDHIYELDVKLLGAPGESFSYSNDGYGILGALITQVSGEAYESYVSKNILQPAQMTRSFYDLAELKTHENVTMIYAKKTSAGKSEVYEAPVWWDAPSMRATGYLKSTVHDMLRFLEIIRNKGVVDSTRILAAESVDHMIYPHVEFETGRFYGYGLRITPDYFGSTLVGHGGGLKGVSSSMGVLLEEGISGVVLSNLDSLPIDRILTGSLNNLKGKEFTESPFKYSSYELAESDLEKFVGTFRSDEGMNLRFDVGDGRLRLHSGSTSQNLRSISPDSFVTKGNQIIRFPINSSGEIDRVSYSSRQIFKQQ